MTARLAHDEPAAAVAAELPVPVGARWARWSNGHVATVLAALVVVGARWWAAHPRRVIHLVPDEPGQLAITRFLGGGERWNLLDHSTWRPLFGVLLAPATWFTDDPVAIYRAGLACNALLGGISCALLALVAARLTGRSRPVCAGLALVVALAPALLFTTDWVWSESLVQATSLVFLLAALRFTDVPGAGWGAVMVVAAAAGFATHSRLLALSVSAVALVVAAVWRGILDRRRAVGLVVGLAVALFVVARSSSWLVARIWEDPAPTNSAGSVLGQLARPASIVVAMVGQTWYQLVATVGVVGIGAIALGRSAARRVRDRRPGEPGPADARIVLTVVLPLMLLSMVFMSDRWRPDQIVYGRYNDAALAVVVLAGLGSLLAAGRRRLLVDGTVTIGVLVASGVALWLAKRDELSASELLRPMVLGLVPFTSRARLDVPTVTLAATVLAVVVLTFAAVVPHRRRAGTLIALGLVLVAGGALRTRPVIDGTVNHWARVATLQDVDELPAGVVVRDRVARSQVVSRSAQRVRLLIYEFYLVDHELVLDGDPAGAGSPFVIAPLDDRELLASGARLLWRDPSAPIGLWLEPAGPS